MTTYQHITDRRSSYWVSYSMITCNDPGIYMDSSHYPISPTNLSIIIHPSLRQNFSTVQLVISTVADEAAQGLIAVMEPRPLSSFPGHHPSDLADVSEMLTIILELKVRPPGSNFFSGSLLFELEHISAPKTNPRILFRRQFPLHSERQSHTIKLHGSGRFVSAIDIAAWQPHVAVSTYQISALPIWQGHGVGTGFASLPRDLVVDVASHLWKQKFDICQSRNILSMAVVCKAWKYATSAYFQKVGSLGYSIRDVGALVRSLTLQPQMAKHFTTFHLHTQTTSGFRHVESCTKLIACCPYLQDLRLSHSVYHQCRIALSARRNIRMLHVFADAVELDPNHVDTLPELYDLVRDWASLETLEISVSNSPRTTCHKIEAVAQPSVLSLRSVSLYGCTEPTEIEMTHLHPFLHSTSALCTLQLTNFSEISNEDMRSFLITHGETLELLTILRCRLKRQHQEEEFAIDAALPHLQKLQYLEADHASAGLASVTRKHRCIQHIKRRRCCELQWSTDDDGNISKFTDALKVTGWSFIRLRLNGNGIDTASPMMGQWRMTAAQRGIELAIERMS